MKKNFIVILLIFIILIQLFQILYFNRSFFSKNYDVLYWKDRFEHSQWVLPLSKRIIGDDGLYAYTGYALVHGGNLISYNPEVPPLGKYLIGIFIVVFKNPAYYAFFFGVGSLFLFYLMSKNVLRTKIEVFFAVSLFFLDPLFFSQFWRPWLDLAQLFFFFLNILFSIYLLKKTNSNILNALIMGLSLGFFAEIKMPILFPLIFLLETLVLLFRRMLREYVVYIIGILVAIFISYSKFFLDGNSFVDLLKLQKYMISFYLKSQLIAHKFAIWQTLFFGQFPSLTSGIPTHIEEWWLIWPIIGIVSLLMSILIICRSKVSIVLKGFSLFILASMVVYTLIPAYPRYLIIVLPFFYLFFVKAIGHFINNAYILLFVLGIVLYGFINSMFFLQSKSEAVLNNFYYNLSHQYFQDIYQEDISTNSKHSIDRNEFRFITQNAIIQAGVKKIDIQEIEKKIPQFGSSGEVKVIVTYYTQNLGKFSERKVIKVIKENSQWKIYWDWDIIFNEFLPTYSVKQKIYAGKRGSILDKQGNALVGDYSGYLISVNPEKINLQKENDMIDLIGKLGYVMPVHLQNEYLENAFPNSYVPLVTFFSYVSKEDEEKLLSFSGVKITPFKSRIYSSANIGPLTIKNTLYDECCTRIYSSYNYHGIEGLEKEYDFTLSGHDGGEIILENGSGEIVRRILEKEKKDGNDVTFPYVVK